MEQCKCLPLFWHLFFLPPPLPFPEGWRATHEKYFLNHNDMLSIENFSLGITREHTINKTIKLKHKKFAKKLHKNPDLNWNKLTKKRNFSFTKFSTLCFSLLCYWKISKTEHKIGFFYLIFLLLHCLINKRYKTEERKKVQIHSVFQMKKIQFNVFFHF